MRFVSTGYIDTQNGEVALGASDPCSGKRTNPADSTAVATFYIASEGTGFCTHAHKDDENSDRGS